jgi:hypothetical protein
MTDWGFAMDWAATDATPHSKKKQEITAMSHTVLHIIPKNPEHPHIRNEMYQVGMQEH